MPDGSQTDPTFGDFVQPFQVEGLGVRGRLVRLEESLGHAIGPHGYPDAVAAMLAETATLTAMLSSALKFDGVFTLQTQGDGPIGTLMADITSTGGFRVYSRFDAERLAAAEGERAGAAVGRLLGAGHVAFTVDQGPDTDRYQGIVELAGESLADCVQAYFRRSEQLETAIVVTASEPADGDKRRSAALMIQRLPGRGRPVADGDAEDGDDEPWRRAAILMSSITAGELLDGTLPARDILFRLFHEDGVRVYKQRPVFHACRCSKDKVETTLGAFPRADIEAMAVDGRVTVTCEFCKTDYAFEVEDLDRLFDGAVRGAGTP